MSEIWAAKTVSHLEKHNLRRIYEGHFPKAPFFSRLLGNFRLEEIMRIYIFLRTLIKAKRPMENNNWYEFSNFSKANQYSVEINQAKLDFLPLWYVVYA